MTPSLKSISLRIINWNIYPWLLQLYSCRASYSELYQITSYVLQIIHYFYVIINRILQTSDESQDVAPDFISVHESSIENPNAHALLLMVHGGSYLEASGDMHAKVSDFIIFQSKLKEVHRMHFLKSHSKVNSRLVACPFICTRSLACLSMLKSVNTLTSTSLSMNLTFSTPDKNNDASEIENRMNNFAFGAIPFLIRSDKRWDDLSALYYCCGNFGILHFLKLIEAFLYFLKTFLEVWVL